MPGEDDADLGLGVLFVLVVVAIGFHRDGEHVGAGFCPRSTSSTSRKKAPIVSVELTR